MWMVRAGRGGEWVDDFIERSVIAFGGELLGALKEGTTKEELLRLYAERYPHEKEASRASWASQLLRFLTEMQVGDEVITADLDRRRYVYGSVASAYTWSPDPQGKLGHTRQVLWTHECPRDALGVATRNTLGSVLTVFRLNDEAAADVLKSRVALGSSPASKPAPPASRDNEALGSISADTFGRADEFIEDRIDSLSWSHMQDLVAGILRAMGYRTTVSAPGPDRGVDVFASPDGLGLEEPRIFVEVKHREQQIGAREVRAFVGGRRKGDKCLYVSTGGFSKDAYYEADRADVALTLITLPRLRQLVVEYYDKLDGATRALVPLQRLYWPVVT